MAFGHGKIILLGEHAVVYGKPALVASISRGVSATAQSAQENILELEPWNRSIRPDAASSDSLARAFAALIEAIKPAQAFAIKAKVQLPAASGLGCSAAIGVAVTKAIDDATKGKRSDEELMQIADAWERVFHANPSGIDVAAAFLGDILLYKRGEPPTTVSLRRPMFFVVGHSGETSNTKDMVMSIARQRERDPARVNQQLDAIGGLVETAVNTLKRFHLEEFGQLMDMNHSLLSSMMLCTKALDEMCTRARAAGALGAKLTGAGGGGCMIALAADEISAHKIQQDLSQLGREAFVARVPN